MSNKVLYIAIDIFCDKEDLNDDLYQSIELLDEQNKEEVNISDQYEKYVNDYVNLNQLTTECEELEQMKHKYFDEIEEFIEEEELENSKRRAAKTYLLQHKILEYGYDELNTKYENLKQTRFFEVSSYEIEDLLVNFLYFERNIVVDYLECEYFTLNVNNELFSMAFSLLNNVKLDKRQKLKSIKLKFFIGAPTLIENNKARHLLGSKTEIVDLPEMEETVEMKEIGDITIFYSNECKSYTNYACIELDNVVIDKQVMNMHRKYTTMFEDGKSLESDTKQSSYDSIQNTSSQASQSETTLKQEKEQEELVGLLFEYIKREKLIIVQQKHVLQIYIPEKQEISLVSKLYQNYNLKYSKILLKHSKICEEYANVHFNPYGKYQIYLSDEDITCNDSYISIREHEIFTHFVLDSFVQELISELQTTSETAIISPSDHQFEPISDYAVPE